MATLQDVANEAQVSPATVSRVLHGHYAVTEEKRQRVIEAAAKVGYPITQRPSPGQPERLGAYRRILLVVSSCYIPELLHSFQATAAPRGYQVLCIRYRGPQDYLYLHGLLQDLSGVLAGILLINALDASRDFQALLEPWPLVQIGEPIMERKPNLVVYNDEIRMGEDAVHHLVAQGCRKIGMLAPEPLQNIPLFAKQRRLHGYYLGLLDHELPVDATLVAYTDLSLDGGYEGIRQLFSRHPDMDGVIGATNTLAQGASYALRDAKRDIQLLSIDNSEIWNYYSDKLAYIDPHHEDMAATALDTLHSAISGQITQDFRVVIRHTLHQIQGSGCA